jgi:PEP-CTERM motif
VHINLYAVALAAVFGCIDLATPVKADVISATYYGNFNENVGSGITFSNPFASETMSSISELNGATTPLWPSGNSAFGADFKSSISVPTTGDYTLDFGVDDAGYVFIGNVLVASLPGANGFSLQPYTVHLTAGVNSFELQYANYECCGAFVKLDLPSGVSFVASGVPEPSTWAMMILGFAGVGFMAYRRRSSAMLAA